MKFKWILKKEELFTISFGFFLVFSFFILGDIILSYKVKIDDFVDIKKLCITIWGSLYLSFFLFIRNYYKKKTEKFEKSIEDQLTRIQQSEIQSKESRTQLLTLILPGYVEVKNTFCDIGKTILLDKSADDTIGIFNRFGKAVENLGSSFFRQEEFMPEVFELVEKCFSYEIIRNKITITKQGEGFFSSGALSQMYYLLFNVFKEILHRIPENGHMDINFEMNEKSDCITIIDDGFFLPEALKVKYIGKNKGEIDRLFSLTKEEVHKLLFSLKWKIVEKRTPKGKNITQILIIKESECENDNIIFLKNYKDT